MLNNPNWNKTAKDVSLEDFIGWLETKDPNEIYDYHAPFGHCALGQYMADRKIEWSIGGHSSNYAKTCDAVFGGHGFLEQEPLFLSKDFGHLLQVTKRYRHIKENA